VHRILSNGFSSPKSLISQNPTHGLAVFIRIPVFPVSLHEAIAGTNCRICANRNFRSPLFHARTGLLRALLGLMFAPAYLPHVHWITVAYFATLAFVVAGLPLVRRSLRRRYPG